MHQLVIFSHHAAERKPNVGLMNALSRRALMKMDSDLLHSPAVGLAEEEEADMNDWKLPLAFMKKRHSEKIEGSKALAQSWRMKDRVMPLLICAPWFEIVCVFLFYFFCLQLCQSKWRVITRDVFSFFNIAGASILVFIGVTNKIIQIQMFERADITSECQGMFYKVTLMA